MLYNLLGPTRGTDHPLRGRGLFLYHANQHGRPDEPQQARNIMPTIERARVIKRGMEKGAGGIYRILWDTDHYCYRVLPDYGLGWQRHNRWDNLLMVE